MTPILHNDPNGDLFGLDNLVGALVGAVVEIGSQVVSNAISGKKLTDINWKQVGVATVEGLVTDGASNLTKVAVKVGAALARSTIDYAENHKISGIKDVGNIVKNAAINVVADKVVGGVAKLAKGVGGKTLNETASKLVSSKNSLKEFVKATGVDSKTASVAAKFLQTGQKAVAKEVRNASQTATTVIVTAVSNSKVERIQQNTNFK